MDELADFSKQKDNVDFAGRVVWEEVKDTLTAQMMMQNLPEVFVKATRPNNKKYIAKPACVASAYTP